MSVSLSLIWGPTSTGKTNESISLSRLSGSPVISLDRIQCFTELSTGSGRPSSIELRGTQRIYLAERRLSEGLISATDANLLLKNIVSRLSASHSHLILEGGSISLLNEIFSDPEWGNGFNWASRRFRLGEPTAFIEKAYRRVIDMFSPLDGSASLLDELARAWLQTAHHALLENIDGYRSAILFARQEGLHIKALPLMSDKLKEKLARKIAEEYFQHAMSQERSFLPVPFQWSVMSPESAVIP